MSYLEVALPGSVVMHPANEIPLKGPAVRRALAKAKWNGTRPGYPDIITHWNGRTFLFEVKAKGNYMTKTQREMRERLEANNIPFAVVRSVDDVAEALKAWGIEVRIASER